MDDKEGEEKIQFIAAGGKTRIECLAKDNKMNLTTDIDLTISAKGKLGIQGEEAIIKFSKGLKIEADEIISESKSKDLTVKAGQNLTLEGSMVKLN